MGRIKRFATAFRRYKRSRGFGIHSPFAFSFVRSVLMGRLPYYAYADIAAARRQALRLAEAAGLHHPRVISFNSAKMLFRVVCHFNPRAILQIGTSYGVSARSVLDVDSRSRLVLCEVSPRHRAIFDAIVEPVSDRIIPAPSIARALASYRTLDRLDSPPVAIINALPDAPAADVAEVTGFIIENEGILIMRNLQRDHAMASLWRATLERLPFGMTFTNGKIGFIVAQRHLPRQNFNLWF